MVCLEDLKGLKVKPEWSELDVLAEVAAVAVEKFEEERLMKESACKKHGLDINNQEGLIKNPLDIISDRERLMINETSLKEESAMTEEVLLWEPIKKKRSPRRRCFKKIAVYPFGIFQEDRSMREIFKNPAMEEDHGKSSNVENCSKGQTRSEKVKKRRKTMIMQRGPEPPPDMPIEFNNFISEMRGSDAILVIQKPLYWTDTNPGHNRLSIPLSQIRAEFLREDEEMELNAQGGIEVELIEPSLELSTLTLKKWNMKKTSSIYALVTNWSRVVKNNNLDEGVIVQLWSFRVDAKLCLALIRVGMGGDEGGSSSRSNGDGASTSQTQDYGNNF